MLRREKAGLETRDARAERHTRDSQRLVSVGCPTCTGYVAELRHEARRSASRARRSTAQRTPW